MHVTISLFPNVKTNRADRETLDFEAFLSDFRTPALSALDPSPENVKAIKQSAPAFAPAIFKEDRRKKANIEHAQVLAFDIDEDVDAYELSERLRRRGISYAIHHTTSAGFSVAETGRGSVHVLIPLARPVDHETYLRYWDEARAIFHGIEVDMSKRSAESLFFAPTIFDAHKDTYFFDCVTDAPFLGSSGFRPFRPDVGGVDRWVQEVRDAAQKHVVVNRVAFTLGLVGLTLEETKDRLLGALRENVVSEPVTDWDAAEHTIVKAWTDGAAQHEVNEARPKFVPPEARAAAKKTLEAACDSIHKGEALRACAYRVGQFIPHVLEYETSLDALKRAWERAKIHDTRSLADCVRELVSGLDDGKRSPRGLFDEWRKQLKFTPDGLGFNASENNVHVVLEHHPDLAGLVAFDVRDGAPCYLGEPPWLRGQKLSYPRRVADSDKQRLARWLRDELGVPQINTKSALSALVDLAHEHANDSLLDYYRSLPMVEGTEVLETMLISCLGAEDTPYVRAVTKRWFVGVVARQFDPGCKMDTLLIAVGDQGYGKSTFFQEIFPKELQDRVFTDSLNVLKIDRDQIVKLARYAVVEIGEMAAMSKSDIEAVKALISQKVGDERAAYAQLHAQYPRRTVFVGTTNRDEFLRDPTGNRRFWPVRITSRLDLQKLRTIRDMMWAQAVSAYMRGEPWYLSAEEEACAVEVREGYEEQDIFVEKIRSLLAVWPADGKFDDSEYRTQAWQLDGVRMVRPRLGQLMLRLGAELRDRPVERRLADCLRKLGYGPKSVRQGETIYRIWEFRC